MGPNLVTEPSYYFCAVLKKKTLLFLCMLQGNRKSRKRLSKYLKKPMQKKKYLKKQVKDLIQYASFIERETSPNDAVMESLEANWHKSRHTIEIQQTHDHQIYPIGV